MIDHKVFESICEELAYASKTYGTKSRSVGENLLLIDKYFKEAMHAWQNYAGDDRALHELRKVGAMVLQCLGEHGCPRRGSHHQNGNGQDDLPVRNPCVNFPDLHIG